MADDNSLTFNINDDDFMTFIESLLRELSHSTSHGIPRLMPESGPRSILYVRLISGNRSITLCIERGNLYVRGYSPNGRTFWEFSDTTLILGSRPLEYNGSYADAHGVRRIANVALANVRLGRMHLGNAVTQLSDIEDPNSNQKQSAEPLLTMILMIAEATRSRILAQHIVDNWWNSTTLTTEMELFVHNWNKLSSSVQRADTCWVDSTPLPDVPIPDDLHIWTVGQAIAAVAIMMYYHIIRRTGKSRAPRHVTESSDESSDASHIRTLVRIDYVRIENIDGENPGQLYGTVMVNDYWHQQAVYDRSSDNPENKGPGEYASLTSPSTPISGDDAFIISVSLWDHDKLSPDDEIAKGDIVWDRRIEDSSYDSPLKEEVSGKYGSVTVGYSVIREALNATIHVVMIDGDGESPADVYGTIKALIPLGGSSVTRTLFDEAENNYVEVHPQQSIPLTREAFPVPENVNLTIEADLWDKDTLSPDDPIAQGSVQFLSTIGTQEMIITGKYGEVRVSVTCE